MSIIHKYSARGTLVAIASLLAVFAFAVPNANAATKGAWSFNSDGSNVVIGDVEPNFMLSVAPVYGVGIGCFPASSIVSFDLGTKISNSGGAGNVSRTHFANVYTYCGLNSSDPAGYYYFLVNVVDGAPITADYGKFKYYYELYWDGVSEGVPTAVIYTSGFFSTTQTRFLDVDVTGTSTVNINATYFLEQSEIDTTKSEYNPSAVRFQYSLRPGTSFDGFSETIDATVQGTSTQDIDFSGFADGTYDLLVSFSNAGCSLGLSVCPFKDSYVYTDFTIASGTLVSVGTNEFYDGTVAPDEERYKDCSLTNIGNCISNAFVYLFFPSQDALNSFTILGDQLDTRFPFAYVFDTYDVIQTLYTTSQTQSLDLSVPFASYGDITLISEEMLEDIPMSATINTLLTYILWIMFMLQMYNRTRNIFNSQTV